MTLFEDYLLAMEKANELELQSLIARREATRLQEEYRQHKPQENKREILTSKENYTLLMYLLLLDATLDMEREKETEVVTNVT